MPFNTDDAVDMDIRTRSLSPKQEPFSCDSSLCLEDESAPPDSIKKKEKDKRHFAQIIDESVWFHMIYGVLDGISVSYSTVKFLCDVTSKDNDSYHQKLDHALVDPISIGFIAASSIILTLISALGNYGSKKNGNHKLQKLATKYLPYIRDTLKAPKNTYKGLKSIQSIMQMMHHHASDLQIRSILIPVAVSIGLMAMLNRHLRRHLKDKQKALLDELKEIKNHIAKYNEHTKTINELLNQEADLKAQAIKASELISSKKNLDQVNTLTEQAKKIRSKLDKLQQSPPKDVPSNIDELLTKQQNVESQLTQFEKKYQNTLYTTSLIAALADGPYLYAGMLTLGATSGPLLICLCSIMVTMLIATLFTRWQEEVQSKRKAEILRLETIKEVQIKKSYDAYHAYLEQCKQNGKESEKSIASRNELLSIYRELSETKSKLNQLQIPSTKEATIEGVKDGLSLFGAITSVYFATSIILFLAGSSFPPALIAAAVFIGFAAMITRAVYRAHKAKLIKKEVESDQRAARAFDTNEIAPPWLGIEDYNTDGLTKGEFYFQQVSEVVRCVGSGVYKGKNYADFAFEHQKEQATIEGHDLKSHPMMIFWICMAIPYATVLVFRAIGKAFGKSKQENKKNEHKENTKVETLSEEDRLIDKPSDLSRSNPVNRISAPSTSHSLSGSGVHVTRFFSPKEKAQGHPKRRPTLKTQKTLPCLSLSRDTFFEGPLKRPSKREEPNHLNSSVQSI